MTYISVNRKRSIEKTPTEVHVLHCRKCGRLPKTFPIATTSYLCWICTANSIPPPEQQRLQSVPSGKPRGWKFMKEFVDKDGTVYHKGVEQPKLKGTMPPTEINAIKQKSASKRDKQQQREELLAQINELRSELKTNTGLSEKQKQRIEKQVTRLNKRYQK
jgi:hypothetical protein